MFGDFFSQLFTNYTATAAVILFGTGFALLLFDHNLIKKCIGFNLMNMGLFLFLASGGFIRNTLAPAAISGGAAPEAYANPLPAGLVLVCMLISVSFTALFLALTVRLYERFHTLRLDELLRMAGEKAAVLPGEGMPAGAAAPGPAKKKGKDAGEGAD